MKRIDLSRETTRIVLPRGIPVTLTLPEDLVMPEPPTYLAIDGFELVDGGTDDTGYALRWATWLRDPTTGAHAESLFLLFRPETRRLELSVPLAGTLLVRCCVMHVTEEGGSRHSTGVPIDPSAMPGITVVDSAEEQVFELSVDPAPGRQP